MAFRDGLLDEDVTPERTPLQPKQRTDALEAVRIESDPRIRPPPIIHDDSDM
jgi:hypothetical protein